MNINQFNFIKHINHFNHWLIIASDTFIFFFFFLIHKMACKWHVNDIYYMFIYYYFFFIKGGLRHSNISLFGSRHFLLPRSDAGGVWRRTQAFLHSRRMYTENIVFYWKNIIQIKIAINNPHYQIQWSILQCMPSHCNW